MKQKIITQIGSLPYDNIRDAIEYSLEHDIPFLPELPKRGDLMMEYIKNPGQLSCLADFRSAIKGQDTVKIQAIGPVSIVSASMRGYTEKEAIERSYTHIIRILDCIDARRIVLVLDEPSLETACFDFKRAGMTREEYESTGVVSVDRMPLWQEVYHKLKENSDKKISFGIHTCGNADWDELSNLDFIEFISFDASRYSKIFMQHRKRDKSVAWGIRKFDDILLFRDGDLITPPCGLGNSTDEHVCDLTLEMLLHSKEELTRFQK
jgi:hypothetical protein